MTPQTLGILIGGLLPGVLFGLSNVVVKLATLKGISSPWYIVCTGVAVVTVGFLSMMIIPDRTIHPLSASLAFTGGFLWAVGMTAIVVALQYYASSISVLTPLFNLNTLVAVALGLWIFAEWKTVHVPQLVLGSLLIVAGGVIVARA